MYIKSNYCGYNPHHETCIYSYIWYFIIIQTYFSKFCHKYINYVSVLSLSYPICRFTTKSNLVTQIKYIKINVRRDVYLFQRLYQLGYRTCSSVQERTHIHTYQHIHIWINKLKCKYQAGKIYFCNVIKITYLFWKNVFDHNKLYR